MSVCYMNGKYLPVTEATLPITDMAVQRGVAVFESIRIYEGRLFAAEEHLSRFARSAEGAGIEAQSIIERELQQIISRGLKEAGCPKDGLVKPYLTGGDINNKGHFPSPRLFVIFDEIRKTSEEERKNGAVLEPNYTARPFPLYKSTNYLFGLIAMAQGKEQAHESLYMPHGEITESMTNNFFLCHSGKIITAPTGRVLAGVTRNIVLELAKKLGFKTEERCPKTEELKTADEAFITGTVNEVLAVTKIGSSVIGDGKPGPVSQKLYEAFLRELPNRLTE